jgi:hypothetical protein
MFKFDLVVEGEHIKGDVSAAMGDQKMNAKVDLTRAK